MVESTAELMSRLHSQGNLSLVRSETIERIANNLIKKEKYDEEDESCVPAGAKPRAKKSRQDPGPILPPALPPGGMAQVKNELVYKFLDMALPSTSPDPGSSLLNGLLDRLKPETIIEELAPKREHRKNGNHKTEKTISTGETLINNASGAEVDHPPVQREPTWEEELAALLPSIDPLFNYDIDTDVTPSVFSSREYVTYEDVSRLFVEQLPGVNGQFDMFTNWRDWTQCMTSRIDDTRVLHILPYVCIDD